MIDATAFFSCLAAFVAWGAIKLAVSVAVQVAAQYAKHMEARK